MSTDYTINILMMGGRRCGKTSVLASMQSCFESEFGSSNLTINIDDPSTMLTLTNKMDDIRNYYNDNKANDFQPDDSPTKGKPIYELSVNLKSKPKGKIKFNFLDYPGDWILPKEDETEEKRNLNNIRTLIEKSGVIIIAIDTPHLMEQTHSDNPDALGIYNEKHNRCNMTCQMLKSYLDFTSQSKMILFVPLKCEKYRNEGNMNLVKRKIKVAYKPLLDHINNEYNRQRCTVAITPIYTFGTAEFKRFERDENGKIIIDPVHKTPKYPMYGFTSNALNAPSPKYCEQPLVYVLIYLLTIAKKSKDDTYKKNSWFKNLFEKIGESFFRVPSADDFIKEINNLKKRLVTNEDGFEVVTDPFNLK